MRARFALGVGLAFVLGWVGSSLCRGRAVTLGGHPAEITVHRQNLDGSFDVNRLKVFRLQSPGESQDVATVDPGAPTWRVAFGGVTYFAAPVK